MVTASGVAPSPPAAPPTGVQRLVWSQAFKALESADEVALLGYSFPTTDVVARTLFHGRTKSLAGRASGQRRTPCRPLARPTPHSAF